MFENHPQSDIPIIKNENQACQASTGNGGKCGEVKTLDILKEFQQLYENKLSVIKDDCSCTSTRIKIQMLEDWVKDLTEQNTMLVQVVEELEQEASERVSLLEEKLRHSSKTSFEIMKTLQQYDAQNISSQSDILQRLMYFQSDVNSLTEFIKRVREDGNWSTEGLHFYSVSKEDLSEVIPSSARKLSKQTDLETSLEHLKKELSKSKQIQNEHEKETKRKEMLIYEQTEQIEKLNDVVERCANSAPDRQKLLEELHELRGQLKLKSEDFKRLDMSVKDMREALTAEVADKHDNVVALRRECQLLEERCRQADKQTHFKDDIIKEMRKELKHYRSKFELDGRENNNEEFQKQILELQEENNYLHTTISSANAELNILHGLIRKYYMYEEYEDNILVTSKQLKIFKNKSSEEIFSSSITSLIKTENSEIIGLTLPERLHSIEKYCGELLALARENMDQHESMSNLKNQINMQMSTDNMLVIHEADCFSSVLSESELVSENDITKTVLLLKNDISKMILWKSDNEMNELKKHVSNIGNTLYEIQSKDQLIKNKDEMINIQNDTLNVAQRELKELRDKLADIEKERDTRMQEVQNLQQALKINQNTIEELEKTLRNSEEKANNIQQSADLYVETISLLENAKNKAETEVEQQRITIGNLQDALVSTKKQLQGVQGQTAAELKEKCGAIYTLYQELDEMQTQYMDCYGENVKLSQTADCLRDANLELKVVNIDLQQDIQELNTKIMNDKIIITALEDNIKKILSANEVLEGDIYLMKSEMGNLSSELKILQELLKLSASPTLEENNCSLSKSLTILQEHSEALVEQLKMTQKQVSREMKLNDINTGQISELQKLLDKKAEELQETKFKLDHSIRESKEYENKLKEKELKIIEFEKQQNLNDYKTDTMVLTCNSDLICLKQKIDVLNKILNEKSNEILRLHAELSIKADTITNLLKENEAILKDNKKFTHNALNLEDQLEIYKSRYTDVNEKYNKCKIEMEHLKQWEDTLQEEYRREKKMLNEKLEASKKEESKLNNMLKESKDDLEKLKITLKQKDDEVKNSSQEEIISLKEEINRLTKIRNRVLGDNQKLQDQIAKLNINTTQFENHNTIISQQLDKCLDEINSLQCSKDKLEERNIQLETELEHLQRAFTEVNHEIRYKIESFITLEQELSETKCSRDEICAESRMVVNNVRAWLEEQKRINVALNNTVKEKNLVIEELTMEKNLLMKNIKDVCERYENLSEELHLCRQYLADMKEEHNRMIKSPPPLKRSVYTWGSQGSVGESPINSPVLNEEPNYDYYFDGDDSEPNPARWMRKVQNMSEDLLKSKKYWQTKMSKTTKKIKPVKDKNLKST